MTTTTAAGITAATDMEQMAARLPFWSLLTDREQETVRRGAVTRRYEKGALIHDGGSECLGMLLVLSGEIRTYLLSDEGREVTLYRLYPDDLCVLSASCVISQITFDTQICAQRETEVLIIPGKHRRRAQRAESSGALLPLRTGDPALFRRDVGDAADLIQEP